MPTVVYLPAETPEGYVWETIEEAALPLFLERGWCSSPLDFGKINKKSAEVLAEIPAEIPVIPKETPEKIKRKYVKKDTKHTILHR